MYFAPDSKRRFLFTFLALFAVTAWGPSVGFAQKKDDDKEDKKTASAEDEDDDGLYSCKKARGRFKVNIKDEVELKDLITWAMSFRCENFIYGSGVGGRSAKVVMITPKEMSAVHWEDTSRAKHDPIAPESWGSLS